MFDIRPFGERWAVVAGRDVLLITRTEAEAVEQAKAATATMAHRRIAGEVRTFARDDIDDSPADRPQFPVADLRTWR